MAAPAVGAVPRTPAQRQRRARIVGAATALLEAQDYDRILIRDVAEHAGVALDTLYRYFPSKEHLYAQVLLSWFDRYEARARAGTEGTDTERLIGAVTRAVRAYERRPHFHRLLSVLEHAQDPAVVARYQDFARRFQDVLLDCLRDTPAEDARLMVLATSALMGSLLSSWACGAVTARQLRDDLERFVRMLPLKEASDTTQGVCVGK